jgi:HEAT repeat protein
MQARTAALLMVTILIGVPSVSAGRRLSIDDIPPGTDTHTRTLIEPLCSTDPQTRIDGANRLEWLGAFAIPAIPFLVALLDDNKIVETYYMDENGHSGSDVSSPGDHATEALNNLGEPAVFPVMEVLKHASASACARAVYVLATINNPLSANALAKALRDRSVAVRRAGARWVRFDDPKIEPAFVKLLKDSNVEVRQIAADRLASFALPTTTDSLIEALHDKDSDVRRSAVEGLEKIGNRRAVPALTKRLKDRDRDVREAAADAIRHIAAQDSG